MVDNGLKDTLKGKAKDVAGTVTGDDKKKAEGMLDQAIGKVKEVAADAKEKAEDVIDDVKEKFDKNMCGITFLFSLIADLASSHVERSNYSKF